MLRFSILAVILVVILVGYIGKSYARYNGECKAMDRKELNYDADGPFIMIDKKTGLVGVYYATTPIAHFRVDKTDRFTDPVINIPTLVYGENVDKSTWWHEGHTTKGDN